MKNTYLKFGLLSILFALFACSEEYIDHQGSGVLTGKVVSAENNQPMEHVKIETSPISSTVFTDEKGNFKIENITTGEYSVKAETKNYLTVFKAAVVHEQKTSNVVFEMQYANANNKPPSIPILTTPIENIVLQSTTTTFKWTSTDPENDELTYTLKLHNDKNSKILVFESLKQPQFTYDNLELGTKYFWQISVSDPYNPEVTSELGSFSVFNAPKSNRLLYTKNINGNLVIFSSNQDSTQEY